MAKNLQFKAIRFGENNEVNPKYCRHEDLTPTFLEMNKQKQKQWTRTLQSLSSSSSIALQNLELVIDL